MAVAMIGPKFYAWDRNGKPLAFGKLYTYQARTNTPKPTYQSEDQVVENTNPVILNGEGYANVYLDGSYKMVLKDKDENEIWSSDPVSSAQAEEWVNCLPAEYVSPTSFKVAGNFTTEFVLNRRVRIDNSNVEYDYSNVIDSSYAAGFTTVIVSDGVVETDISSVCTSIVSPSSSGISDQSDNRYRIAFSTVEEMIQGVTQNGTIVSFAEIERHNGIVSVNWNNDVSKKGGAEYLILTSTDYGDVPDGYGDHSVAGGFVAKLIVDENINQFQFGAIGSGYPFNDGEFLNAYANYCRKLSLKLKLFSGGEKVKHYTTEVVNFQHLDIKGDKVSTINFGAFVSEDSYGFGILTGLPSGRPPVSEVYQMDYRFSEGVCIFGDIPTTVVKISSRKFLEGFGVSGWLETPNQHCIEDEFNAAYQGVAFNWRNVGVTGAGGDGVALKNGIEVCDWYRVSASQCGGYGVTTAGGGGDDNQEYFWADRCVFTANRLDGFLLSNFKKTVVFNRCGGNSNGWYGYGSTQSVGKPADPVFVRAMLRMEGNALGSPNLRVTDCYAEDCARLVALQISRPLRLVEFYGNYTIPTLGLSNPSADILNHQLGIYGLAGGTTPQIYDLRIERNAIQDASRGQILTGNITPANLIDVRIDPQQSIDTFSYDYSDLTYNIKTKEKFNEEITLDKHVQVGRDAFGDGTASTFVSSYIKDNLRTAGQGNNSFSVGAAFLVTANWQATNSQQGGAYLVYAFVLPDGQVKGESQVIGAGAGFTSPPTVSLNGDLNVPLAANFRGSVTRIDMSGERA